jgi:hypothetical protein
MGVAGSRGRVGVFCLFPGLLSGQAFPLRPGVSLLREMWGSHLALAVNPHSKPTRPAAAANPNINIQYQYEYQYHWHQWRRQPRLVP